MDGGGEQLYIRNKKFEEWELFCKPIRRKKN